jgi:DNA-binding transcriptional regulator YhcF (GntR family)
MAKLFQQPSHRVPPELPTLDQLTSDGKPSDSTAASIQKILRQVAVEKQTDHFRSFYSIRAVANHFHVPPATISRIYRRLSSERLLRMVWGSRTLLEPIDGESHRQCRIVGIPVDLKRFIASEIYRSSILTLQSEIWDHEIDPQLLFFEQRDEEIVNLCRRNHHSQIHTLIWLCPASSHRQTILRLHDLGLRVICLADRLISGISDCYTISRRFTFKTILRAKILKI